MEFGVDLLLVVKCIKTKNYLSVRRKSLFLLVLVSVRFAFLYVNTSFFLRFSPFLIFVTLLFLLCEGEILSLCRFQITTRDSETWPKEMFGALFFNKQCPPTPFVFFVIKVNAHPLSSK